MILLSDVLRGERRTLAAATLIFGLSACAGQSAGGGFGIAGTGDYRLAVAAGNRVGASPLGDYLAGNFALESGLIDEAAEYFGNALASDPDNLELLQQVFLLALAGGHYEAALEQAERLLELDPQVDEARLLLALEQVRQGRHGAAREHLAQLSEGGIAALAVPFLDAWALFGAGGGDAEAARAAIARLEAGEPLGPLNQYHTAMLLDLGGDPARAREVLAEAMPEDGRAPVRMVQAHAGLLARAGDTAAAIELVRSQLADGRDQPLLLETLAELERGAPPPRPFTEPGGGMADALLGIAEALHQEGGSARGVVYARFATYLRPELPEAALLVGDIMAEQANLEGAIAGYRGVRDGSPFAYAAGLRTARALHDLERKEEAYALLEELGTERPDRNEALVQLGDLLRRDEEYARAEDAYSRAIERIRDPASEDWTLFYARGITHERTKRWQQAEADFLKALELEPEQPFVLNYLGYSWVDMGMNLDRAKDMLRRAVELRPNDGFIVDSLGWVHYRLGEYRDAVERLERAVELEPGDPVINDHLGDAYWRVGRQREARYQWQRALSLEPEDDQVIEIERKLKSGLPEKRDKLDHT